MLVAQSCLTLHNPLTLAHQAPLSMEFPRQEYGSGLPFPSPGDLPDPEMEPRSPVLQAGSLLPEPHAGRGGRNTQKEVRPTAPMQLPASPSCPPEGAFALCRHWVFRASLVVQWLRIHLPIQGTWVQSLNSIPKK